MFSSGSATNPVHKLLSNPPCKQSSSSGKSICCNLLMQMRWKGKLALNVLMPGRVTVSLHLYHSWQAACSAYVTNFLQFYLYFLIPIGSKLTNKRYWYVKFGIDVYVTHGNSRASSRSSSRSSAKDRSRASSTPTDEDSSAGSSGWESSDGSSSVDSASVESYKGDLTSLKSGSTSTTPIDGSIISSTSSSQELGRVANPQENNYAMDRG